tara:strand:- start:1289 stop:3316 length:2028 start_codon:yes stop_codon:yes gene_type:complete
MKYFQHIDSLRGISILLVILFHFYPNFFVGGFLGVDIFFVISGYVITYTSLYKYKNDKFTLINFYIKRFFRIFPLLFIVVLTTFIAYLFFGYLFELNYVSKIALSSLFGLSNIFLIYLKDDYFLQNEINPLLHTWSLGIEEQFYLFFPILFFFILFIWKSNFKLFIYIFLSAIIFLSLYVFLFYNGPYLGSFYSPFSRFWELMIGCFLVFFRFDIKKSLQIFLSFLILFLLTICIFDLINIISIKIKTLLIILFSIIFIKFEQNSFVKIIGQNKILSRLGKISYSMYLWHLPVLYFVQIYFPNNIYYLLSLFLILFVSELSYRYIETPFRVYYFYKKLFLIFVSLFFLVVFLILFFLLETNSIKEKKTYNETINVLKNYSYKINYFEKKFNINERMFGKILFNNKEIYNCEYNLSSFSYSNKIDKECFRSINNKNNLLILLGDSHATHLLPMINQTKEIGSVYVKTFNGCLFVKNLRAIPKNVNWTDTEVGLCQNYIDNQLEILKSLDTNNFDNIYILISSRYSAYIKDTYFYFNNSGIKINENEKYDKLSDNLNKTLDYIKEINSEFKIILFSPLPEFNFYPYSCLLNKKYCNIDKSRDSLRVYQINKIFDNLKKQHINLKVFDPYNIICKDEILCSIYDRQKDILFYKDKDHLSKEGSEYLTIYFDQWILKNF